MVLTAGAHAGKRHRYGDQQAIVTDDLLEPGSGSM